MSESVEEAKAAKAEWPTVVDMTKPLPKELLAGRQHSDWDLDNVTDPEMDGPPVTGTGGQDESLDDDNHKITLVPCSRGVLERDMFKSALLRTRVPDSVINGRGETENNENGNISDAGKLPGLGGSTDLQNSSTTASGKGKSKAVRFRKDFKTAPEGPLIASYTAAQRSQATVQVAGSSFSRQNAQIISQPYPEAHIEENLLSFTYTAHTPGSFNIDDSNVTGTSRLILRRPAREKHRPFEAPFTLARYLHEVRQLYSVHSRTPDGPLGDITTAVFRIEPNGPVVLQHISSAHEATPAIVGNHADYTTAIFDRLAQDESLTVIRLFKKLFVYDGRDTSSGFGLQMITPYLDRPDHFSYAQEDPELWFRAAFEREVRELLGGDAGNPTHCKVQVDRFKGEWLEYRADMTANQFLEEFLWKIDDPLINIYPFDWRPQHSFEQAEEEREARIAKVFKDIAPIIQPTSSVPAATTTQSTGTFTSLATHTNILAAINAIHREVIGVRSVAELIRREDVVVTNGNILKVNDNMLGVGENMNAALNDAVRHVTSDIEHMRRRVFEELQRLWAEQYESLRAIIRSQATNQATLETLQAHQQNTQRAVTEALQAGAAPASGPGTNESCPMRGCNHLIARDSPATFPQRALRHYLTNHPEVLAGNYRCPWHGCAHSTPLHPLSTYQLRLEQHHGTHLNGVRCNLDAQCHARVDFFTDVERNAHQAMHAGAPKMSKDVPDAPEDPILPVPKPPTPRPIPIGRRTINRPKKQPKQPKQNQAESRWICPVCGMNTWKGLGNRQAHWTACGVTREQLITQSKALATDPKWTGASGFSTKRKGRDEEAEEDNGKGPSKRQKKDDTEDDSGDDKLSNAT